MGRFVLFGAGGCGRDLVRPAREQLAASGDRRQLVFAEDKPSGDVLGIPVLALDCLDESDEIVIALGSSAGRRRVAERCSRLSFGNLFARTSIIGPDVHIGEGAAFSDFTMVTTAARIGRHFQCNYYSYVAHDCVIGDFVTFAPRVSCNGNVHIGDDVYIGTGAVIRQGDGNRPLRIGSGAVIGMGAVVTKDVAPGETIVGNPARPMKRG